MIDTMPDVLPIVDHTRISGLTVATGMSGQGSGIGPGMGRVVPDLVDGRKPAHAMEAFALTRFGRR